MPPPHVRTAVIPAAGLGTRFLPATKAIPKEMLPIVDIPTIQYIVDEAVASGITRIVLVTGRGKEALIDHFDYAPALEQELAARGKAALRDEMRAIADRVEVVSIRQKEPKGLGHAILTARPAVGNEPFAVMLPDDLIYTAPPLKPGIRQLMDIYTETGKGTVALFRVTPEQACLYGIVKFEPVRARVFRVFDMIEKPKPGTAPSDLAIIGRYVFPPSIFTHIENTKPGVGGEIQITDAIRSLADTARGGEGVMGIEFEGERHDAGDKLGYLKAQIAYGLRDPALGPALKAYLRTVLSS